MARARRVHVDVLVIGAGSGRVVLGTLRRGRKTAIVETGPFGGTCLNRGCIPSKMFIHAADVGESARDAARLGVDASVARVRWADIRDRVFGRIDSDSAAGPSQARDEGILVYEGEARFIAPRRVRVALHHGGVVEIDADDVVVATGARPHVPRVVADSGVHFETSDTVMRLDSLPERLVVLGDGPVAVEMAHLFSGLGAGVTVVGAGARLADVAGDDLADRFTSLAGERWTLHLGVEAVRVTAGMTPVRLELSDGRTVTGDLLLVATGRTANTTGIGLAEAGVDVDASGRIIVDEFGRTTAPGVWSLGDASSEVQLKHLANAQARAIAHNIAHPEARRVIAPPAVPAAIFTHPQLAWVGQTESQAQDDGIDVVAFSQMLADTAYGWAAEDTTSVCTVVVARDTGVVIGAQLMAPHASSLIQPLVDAVSCGATAGAVARRQLWIHPAATELVENALLGADQARRRG